MRSLEFKYKNDINFVTIDGANPKNGIMKRLIKYYL